MSVGLNEILNFCVISLLVFTLYRLNLQNKRTNELNKRLAEVEIRFVVRFEDRLTSLEQEIFNQSKTQLNNEV
ncbi:MULTISPECIES: hypothetical protein [Acinetobacter]|uniref:hypothetical protein n=1 Tax=Acinetobacter TaxID=469 RepID=UPI001F05B9F8|nr:MULTISPECIES: hypothetical protein [Acinetobacter]MCH2003656.1 hypothetical protein [Acinetobacter seifertii]WQF74937.1 hypothetical protein OKW95_19570 [Acinetobacter oleivorans]